jgi:hypothetical protein
MVNTNKKSDIIKNIPLSLTREGLFRRMGFGGRSRPPAQEIMDQFDLALDMVKTKNLIQGQAVTLVQKISMISDKAVILTNGSTVPGKRIHELMPHATYLVMVISTIGNALEILSRKFVREDDQLMGVMLDSIGSAAVDCLVEEISHRVSVMAKDMGLMSSSPISPGMPGLPLETQQILFAALPADAIGTCLASSNMMVPFKSSSMIIGLGEDMPTWSKRQVCKKCHLFLHCRYKKEK